MEKDSPNSSTEKPRLPKTVSLLEIKDLYKKQMKALRKEMLLE